MPALSETIRPQVNVNCKAAFLADAAPICVPDTFAIFHTPHGDYLEFGKTGGAFRG